MTYEERASSLIEDFDFDKDNLKSLIIEDYKQLIEDYEYGKKEKELIETVGF